MSKIIQDLKRDILKKAQAEVKMELKDLLTQFKIIG